MAVQSVALSFEQQWCVSGLAARFRLPSVYQLHEYAEAGGLLSYGSGLVTLSAELFRAWAELTVCTTFLLHIRKQKSWSLVKRLKRKPIHHPVVPRAPVRSLLPDQRHEPDGRYDRGCGRSVSVFC
jgi:hypothetical protein